MGREPAVFAVQVDDLNGVCPIISICGEIDLATAPELSDYVRAAIARVPQYLVLDFAGVTFMDCSGIAVIVSARRQLPDPSRVMLKNLAPLAREMLTILRLEDFYVIDGDPK